MIPIGAFARLGQVSVRMLRHYDRIGLLVPARVDPSSGYRSYAAAQLATLNRIVALKDLGLRLDQVAAILDDGVGAEELRGMLTLRRAELEQERARARERLTGVEHRLHLIEKENVMPRTEYVVKSLPAVRLAARRATAATQEEIGELVEPMFDEVGRIVAAAGGSLETALAEYEMTEDGMSIVAGYASAGGLPGTETVDLPAVEHAVCAVHLGSMEGIGAAWQELARWVEDQGWTLAGPCRENYLQAEPADDQSGWVTELQQPVTRS